MSRLMLSTIPLHCHPLGKYKSRYPYSPGEMLQRYIRALADPICNRIDYTTRVAFLGAVARDGLNTPVPSDYTKKSQQAFLEPLPGNNKSWW